MKTNTLAKIATVGATVTVGAVAAHGLDIVINPGTELAGNTAALDAFNRAAVRWESIFSDPITVNINANVFNFGVGNENVIGSASSTILGTGYDDVVAGMKFDALDEPSNGIVLALPDVTQFSALLPAGFSLWDVPNRWVLLTSANAKALGASYDGPDAQIQFNTEFAFDYDNSNGVGVGLMDFETVAAHEIGHALGFVSAVDDVDYWMGVPPEGEGDTLIDPFTLDLFRFPAGALPTDPLGFLTTPRELRPGSAASFSDLTSVYGFSTGFDNGDGNQASHWKADDLTSVYIGMMDPTLNFGVSQSITDADIRALDLIGWDVVVPEPSTYAAGGFLALGLGTLWLRRRSA